MEFIYGLPNSKEAEANGLSAEIISALSHEAVKMTQAEDLLGKHESPKIEELKGKIESQVSTSIIALGQIVDQLNMLRPMSDQLYMPEIEEFQDSLEEKIQKWQKDGSLEWCNKYEERFDGEFNLVVTPNTLVTAEELVTLAINFGQNLETFTSDEFYNQYSPQELSGKQNLETINGVIPKFRFSLVSSSPDPRLHGEVEQQKEAFHAIKATQPNLKVPSPFEAVTSWYALRAKGYELKNNTMFIKTCIRHFDLPPKELDEFACVPRSDISDSGSPYLGRSDVTNRSEGRVAVG